MAYGTWTTSHSNQMHALVLRRYMSNLYKFISCKNLATVQKSRISITVKISTRKSGHTDGKLYNNKNTWPITCPESYEKKITKKL